MSYEKKAAAGAEPKMLVFYYPVAVVFDEAQFRTMSHVMHEKTDKGVPAVEDFAFSPDEEELYLSMLEDAVFDVFSSFLAYTGGITGAIKHNQDYAPSGGNAAKTSYLKIVDNANYNENYLQVVDKDLLKAIRFYINREWFLMKGRKEDATVYDRQYVRALQLLQKSSFQLKKLNI